MAKLKYRKIGHLGLQSGKIIRLLGERAGKESRLRLLDFIIGDNYNRYLSKKVIMIRFALKRASVSRLGIRTYAQTLKVFLVLGAATKEFVGDVIKIPGRFNEIEGLQDSKKIEQPSMGADVFH